MISDKDKADIGLVVYAIALDELCRELSFDRGFKDFETWKKVFLKRVDTTLFMYREDGKTGEPHKEYAKEAALDIAQTVETKLKDYGYIWRTR